MATAREASAEDQYRKRNAAFLGVMEQVLALCISGQTARSQQEALDPERARATNLRELLARLEADDEQKRRRRLEEDKGKATSASSSR